MQITPQKSSGGDFIASAVRFDHLRCATLRSLANIVDAVLRRVVLGLEDIRDR